MWKQAIMVSDAGFFPEWGMVKLLVSRTMQFDKLACSMLLDARGNHG